MRCSITKVATVAVPLASLISLTACRGVVVAASPGTGGTATALAASGTVASPASTAAPASAAANSGAAATPAPGSVVISMTSPQSKTWTANAAVTCARTAVLYLASADGSDDAGYNESLAVRAAPYRGPRSYHALVTLTVTGPQGGIASVSGVPAEPVTLTSTGGTFTIDQTGNDGKTLDATVTWTCP
ncbi:MAG: hypothetical protein WAK83_20805 [Trebonia sp.]|uniref:hypothetical protein n=1 Tax=Trebonia sp. TaxID=2767075 RepID=UPI003BAF8448